MTRRNIFTTFLGSLLPWGRDAAVLPVAASVPSVAAPIISSRKHISYAELLMAEAQRLRADMEKLYLLDCGARCDFGKITYLSSPFLNERE